MKTNIAILGAAGKMGREILRLAAARDDIQTIGAYDFESVGEFVHGQKVTAPPPQLPAGTAVVIDFSSPASLNTHLDLAVKAKAAYVSGVTGFDHNPAEQIQRAAKWIPVLWSSNMSPAMNVMFAFSAQAANALPTHKRFISETHHTAKKDAPSGTALTIAEAIKAVTGEAVAIQSLRMGDVVGEHHLIFTGPGERLEITHRADSRAVFAAGALQAAIWIAGKNPGMYGMKDVLGI